MSNSNVTATVSFAALQFLQKQNLSAAASNCCIAGSLRRCYRAKRTAAASFFLSFASPVFRFSVKNFHCSMSHSKCGCKRQNNCSLDLFNIIDAHNISKYSPTMSKSAKINAASLLFTFPLSSSSSYTVLSIRVFTPFLLYPWSFNITLFAYLLDSLLPFPSSSSTQFSLQSIGDFGTKELLLRFFCFCWSLDISLQMCLQCLHKTLWQSLYVNENCFKNFFYGLDVFAFFKAFSQCLCYRLKRTASSFFPLCFLCRPLLLFFLFLDFHRLSQWNFYFFFSLLYGLSLCSTLPSITFSLCHRFYCKYFLLLLFLFVWPHFSFISFLSFLLLSQ